mmetsp:Transcript_52411/g.159297  ORF Transcript_52411/g.159297 Transcript_52411/m.159297 type:complete len:254 (+) Transcript_52411:197-958(+)
MSIDKWTTLAQNMAFALYAKSSALCDCRNMRTKRPSLIMRMPGSMVPTQSQMTNVASIAHHVDKNLLTVFLRRNSTTCCFVWYPVMKLRNKSTIQNMRVITEKAANTPSSSILHASVYGIMKPSTNTISMLMDSYAILVAESGFHAQPLAISASVVVSKRTKRPPSELTLFLPRNFCKVLENSDCSTSHVVLLHGSMPPNAVLHEPMPPNAVLITPVAGASAEGSDPFDCRLGGCDGRAWLTASGSNPSDFEG